KIGRAHHAAPEVKRTARRSPPSVAKGRVAASMQEPREMKFWAVVAVIVIGAAAAVRLRPSPPPPAESPAFLPTIENRTPAQESAPEGMVWIPGGEFSMGAADPMGVDGNDVGMRATTDSRPVHRVRVDGFWMDRTVVTNAQFAGFVAATG